MKVAYINKKESEVKTLADFLVKKWKAKDKAEAQKEYFKKKKTA